MKYIIITIAVLSISLNTKAQVNKIIGAWRDEDYLKNYKRTLLFKSDTLYYSEQYKRKKRTKKYYYHCIKDTIILSFDEEVYIQLIVSFTDSKHLEILPYDINKTMDDPDGWYRKYKKEDP